MPYQADVYRVLIASPSDVTRERDEISQVIHEWNSLHSENRHVVLLPVRWETHAVPEMGDRPQAIFNRRCVDFCDILIGTFWTRIGTQTGSSESGTVEEIEEFRSSGKPIMLYFSRTPVNPEKIDAGQYAELKAVRAKYEKLGIVDYFESLSELRDKVNRHLTTTVARLTQSEKVQTSNPIANITLSTADKELLRKFQEVLPSLGSIRFIHEHDMGGAFRDERVKDLEDFFSSWRGAESEFLDEDLEKQRQQLYDLIGQYLHLLNGNTFFIKEDIRSIPSEWEYEQPERFDQIRDKLHTLADAIFSTHQEFIRSAKRKLDN